MGGNHAAQARPGTVRAPGLRAAAERLFAVLADGAKGLRFSIQRGYSLREAATRLPIRESYTDSWHAAQELHADGSYTYRIANAGVLEQHLRGTYDVAVEAPSWSSYFVLDIDRPAPDRPDDLESELRADGRRDAVLAAVWHAFALGTDRLPVMFQSPGRGYHLYFGLCRDDQRRPDQYQWPLRWARQHVEHRLNQARLGLKPKVLELFPTGVPLRAPCGRGMALLDVGNPEDPDNLQLQRVYVRQDRSGRWSRDVVPMVHAFLDRFERGRRPLEAWLDPEPKGPAWDAKTWGPFGRREKNGHPKAWAGALSQHNVENPAPLPALSLGVSPSPGVIPSEPSLSLVPDPSFFLDPFPPPGVKRPGGVEEAATDPEGILAVGFLLYGRAWQRHIANLLAFGIRKRGQRHDSVLKVSWHFLIERGYDEEATLQAVDDWLRNHQHVSTTRYSKGDAKFRALSVREAKHYVRELKKRLMPRKTRPSVRAGVLSDADRAVLGTVLSEETEAAGVAIFSYLERFADSQGRVPQPVDLSTAMLVDLCGEQRIESDDGSRSRVYVVALKLLREAGLLTVHTDYSTTHHGRRYCVWYQFGTGALPSREDRGLLLGRRTVEEGELLCFSDGRIAKAVLEPSNTALRPPLGGKDRPAWWEALYEARAFTPAEFFEADQRHVLPGPFRDRRVKPGPVATPMNTATTVFASTTNVAPDDDVFKGSAPGHGSAATVGEPVNLRKDQAFFEPAAPTPSSHAGIANNVVLFPPSSSSASSIPEGLTVAPPLRAAIETAWRAWFRHKEPGTPFREKPSSEPSAGPDDLQQKACEPGDSSSPPTNDIRKPPWRP